MYKRVIVESDFELLDLERGVIEQPSATVVLPFQQTMKPPKLECDSEEHGVGTGAGADDTELSSSSGNKLECCTTPTRDVLSSWRLVKSFLLTPVKPDSSML